jgi:hypothetical protein
MKKETSLQSRVLKRINNERIVPKPSWQHKYIRIVFWCLIAIFVVASSMFAAFLIRDSLDIFHFGRYPRGSVFLPGLVWSVLILIMTYLGIRTFRRTPTGYRYSTARNLLAWMIVTVLFIPILRISGVGPFLHSEFVDRFPTVANFVYQASSWNDPNGGRMAGMIVSIEKWMMTIRAIDGESWNVDITDAKVGSAVHSQV